MKNVEFFGKRVSKLIIGDNPMNGHSYIEDITPGDEMVAYYTAENIKKALHRLEELGYNTMLPLADPYIIRILKEYEAEGGNLQYIWQPYMPMRQDVSMRQMLSLKGTIGIYHQGTTTDYNFESGNNEKTKEQIKQYREMGIPVGIGTHLPEVVELSEKEGWDVDFYVTCMYNARRNRKGEPSGFITGKTKAYVVFSPEDPPVMLDTLKKVTKPVIAYKIFAGGQMFLGKSKEEKQDLIVDAYDRVFGSLKPNDFGAVGVFQRDGDQLLENAQLLDKYYENKK